MLISFDAKRLYNNFTGLGNHSRTTVDILTEYFPENSYLLFTPKVKDNAVTRRYLDKAHCQTLLPKGTVRGSLWRSVGINADIKASGAQVFHGLSNELPLGIRQTGVASVVTIHDVAFKTFPGMYHSLDRKIYDLKWRYAISTADKVLAISQCTKNDILRFYDVDEKKIEVVYQPVAPHYYDYALGNHSETLSMRQEEPLNGILPRDFMLYVGSVNSRKNLLGAVKALELLPKDLQLPLLVVGGGGAYKREVEEYVASHGLSDLVIFPSQRVDDADLLWLYSHARMFVYPSHYEGFGLPVVEALLSGCPVLTSNVSSLPEAAGPFAELVSPHDVEEISHKMQRLLTDSALRESMIRGGREYALTAFHPQKLAQQLMGVYQGVIL